MRKKFLFRIIVFTAVLSIMFAICAANASAAQLLKRGMQGGTVTSLQQDLKSLGYFDVAPTGYFGEITFNAVYKLQSDNGILKDGIVGPETWGLIGRLLGWKADASGGTAGASRGVERDDYLMPWFGGVDGIFERGMKAVIYDIDTGTSFNIRRSYGENHADCETLSKADTAAMKKIYGGEWNWSRRAVIVTVGEWKFAASMAGMPHAGDDSMPADTEVNWRSEGYGAGINLDEVKGNGMDGVFDLHFCGSRTHATDRVDPAHQEMVKKAAAWARNNLK